MSSVMDDIQNEVDDSTKQCLQHVEMSHCFEVRNMLLHSMQMMRVEMMQTLHVIAEQLRKEISEGKWPQETAIRSIRGTDNPAGDIIMGDSTNIHHHHHEQ